MLKQTRVRHRMNFDYLEGFLEVAKVRNFSRAASILYRTQPTLSQQIQRLEREFGGKLFDRDFKAVRLTQAGSTLRRYAEEMLALRTEALDAIGQIKENPRGSLRIGTNDATCLYVLPNALAGFRRLYPQVQVNIYRNFSHKIVEKITGGKRGNRHRFTSPLGQGPGGYSHFLGGAQGACCRRIIPWREGGRSRRRRFPSTRYSCPKPGGPAR